MMPLVHSSGKPHLDSGVIFNGGSAKRNPRDQKVWIAVSSCQMVLSAAKWNDAQPQRTSSHCPPLLIIQPCQAYFAVSLSRLILCR